MIVHLTTHRGSGYVEVKSHKELTARMRTYIEARFKEGIPPSKIVFTWVEVKTTSIHSLL